jgi:hypothetical protein
MSKKRYPALNFENGKERYEFHEIPGLVEAGWT